LLFAICASVVAQNQGKLTARELFYAGKKAQQPQQPRPATTNPPAKAPAATPVPSPPPAIPASTGARPAVVLTNADYAPLGLRYSLLKRNANNQFVEVDVDTTFRSGDGIRVSVESNDDAYLYIVNKGSSGAWNPLFPSPEIEDGKNRVHANQRVEIPPGAQFTFDDRAGDERLFVVLSRTPDDVDKLIYSLDNKVEPVRDRVDTPKLLTVQAPINDALVERLRNVIGRDLVFEKVDDTTSERKEKAAYVVNANGSASGMVVADLHLKHR
jgi:hypothetical protein